MLNIVIPMAGLGSRFAKAGFSKPKPFIDVKGKTMIERVLDNLNIKNSKFTLLARKEHFLQEEVVIKRIKDQYNCNFITIDHLTEGTACTLLYARKYIDKELPLLIANSDQIIDFDLKDFYQDCVSRKLDGSILTFKDKEMNPKWSFAKLNSNNFVTQVREKKPISDIATVGIYLFFKAEYFFDAAIDMILKQDKVNNEYYTCPTYNYLIKDKKKIGVFEIPFYSMHGLGTPEDLEIYLNKFHKD